MTESGRKTTKTLITIAVIVVVLVGIYYAITKCVNNINYSFGLTGGLGSILNDLSAAQSTQRVSASVVPGQGLSISVPMQATVDNLNKTGLNLKNVFANISYNGVPVLMTNPNSAVLANITIPANTKGYVISDNVNMFINKNSIDLVSALISKSKPQVDIAMKANILGLPLGTTLKYNL